MKNGLERVKIKKREVYKKKRKKEKRSIGEIVNPIFFMKNL